jgi:hypothetical protein
MLLVPEIAVSRLRRAQPRGNRLVLLQEHVTFPKGDGSVIAATVARSRRAPYSHTGPDFNAAAGKRLFGRDGRVHAFYFPCDTNIDSPKRNAPTTMMSAPA